jgi:hypothetical protein
LDDQDLAELRLRLTPIGVELFQPVARIGAALENMRRAWRQWMLAAHQCTIGRRAFTRARSSVTSSDKSSYCRDCAMASTAR